jgi:hypothetical protein
MAERRRLQVVYVGGRHRSGTTLLDRMIGQLPGFFSAGELRQIWHLGIGRNRRCACRQRFRDCPFWVEVGRRAFGGWDAVDLDEVVGLRKALDHPSAVPRLFASGREPRAGSAVARYTEYLGRVLEGIRSVSGANVIVDSSKSTAHALLLRHVPDLDLRVVHLVRDSRGVAYSGQRGNRQRVAAGRARKNATPAMESLSWLAYNALTPALRLRGAPYLLVRYEDLVREPRVALGRIAEHAGRPATDQSMAFLHGHRLELGPTHVVYGNRLRFLEGEIELRADDAWRREMPRSSRALVTALTLPLLLRYHYPLGAGAPGRGRADADAAAGVDGKPGQGR